MYNGQMIESTLYATQICLFCCKRQYFTVEACLTVAVLETCNSIVRYNQLKISDRTPAKTWKVMTSAPHGLSSLHGANKASVQLMAPGQGLKSTQISVAILIVQTHFWNIADEQVSHGDWRACLLTLSASVSLPKRSQCCHMWLIQNTGEIFRVWLSKVKKENSHCTCHYISCQGPYLIWLWPPFSAPEADRDRDILGMVGRDPSECIKHQCWRGHCTSSTYHRSCSLLFFTHYFHHFSSLKVNSDIQSCLVLQVRTPRWINQWINQG